MRSRKKTGDTTINVAILDRNRFATETGANERKLPALALRGRVLGSR